MGSFKKYVIYDFYCICNILALPWGESALTVKIAIFHCEVPFSTIKGSFPVKKNHFHYEVPFFKLKLLFHLRAPYFP